MQIVGIVLQLIWY